MLAVVIDATQVKVRQPDGGIVGDTALEQWCGDFRIAESNL